MGKLRHRGQDHTGGDGAWSLAGLSVRGCGLQNAFLFSILMVFLPVSATVQERGGRVPVPGPAGSPAAELPGQAAHRQGDRAGEDEEDGGFAAGAKPGPGRDGCGFGGGMVGLLMGIKFLGLGWGLGGFCSANGNPGLNPRPRRSVWLHICLRAAQLRWVISLKAHVCAGIREGNAHCKLKL